METITAQFVKQELLKNASPEKAISLSRFFKTGKGEYGEGDLFIGVTVPCIREICKKYGNMDLDEVEILMQDSYHECRMLAIAFLVHQYKKCKTPEEKKKIFDFYISHTQFINNWDLVDLSCSDIVGDYLADKPRNLLYEFAQSKSLWQERIAIVTTKHFIKNGDLKDTYLISKILLHHSEDIIHKAVGWMLRETGKKDFDALYQFLTEDGRYKTMPRTMLRYAIEKFPNNMRQDFLHSLV